MLGNSSQKSLTWPPKWLKRIPMASPGRIPCNLEQAMWKKVRLGGCEGRQIGRVAALVSGSLAADGGTLAVDANSCSDKE